MNKISFFTLSVVITALLFSVTSCQKTSEAIVQNVTAIPNMIFEDDKAVIMIPLSSSTGQQSSFESSKFDLNQYIKDNAGGKGIDFSSVKHIYVRSIMATVLNGDANNNLSNLNYTAAAGPKMVINTKVDPASATVVGGNITVPPSDPYNLTIPVINNTDILSHINGTDWVYGFAYKLSKTVTRYMQVKLIVKYELSFKS